MGKQINFYMSEAVQKEFIEYLGKNEFSFLDYNAQIVEQLFSEGVYCLYLYKSRYGELVMRQDIKQIMNTIISPVIEFTKTTVKPEEKRVLQGRLWISDQYFDENGLLHKKEPSFSKDYQMLVRWIKKYVPYQEIKKGEYIIKEYVNDEVRELQGKGFTLMI